jgi:phosphate transport system permease protein
MVGRRRRPVEQAVRMLLAAAALVSVLITVGIVITLLSEGRPFFDAVSLRDFLTGTTWQPVSDEFGIWPLLWASLYIAAMAAAVAIPLGLAGMPTIVLGFFALDAVTPALQDLGLIAEGQLFNGLAAGFVVGVLITPLISSLAEDAMRAVPVSMRDAAYGVGATRRQVATQVVFPAALSGIMAGIVLGLSRAVGETMAVTLAAGTLPNLTADPREPMQTITAYIVQISQGEATRGSIQYESIFAVGIVLFVTTLAINLVALRIVRRYRTVYH